MNPRPKAYESSLPIHLLNKLSVTEISELSKLSKAYISQVKHGNRPPSKRLLETLASYSRCTKTKYDYLTLFLQSRKAMEVSPGTEQFYRIKLCRFLKRSRAGIQHICVSVDNWDEVIARVIGRGGKVYKSGSYDGRLWAHIEGEVGNCVVAIEQRPQLGTAKEETMGVSRVKGKIGNSTELDAIANPSLQHMGVYVKDLLSL